MNYFDRETKNEKIIEEHLRNYESSLDSLVIKLSHEKKEDCIRLHESTLGKEELIAFNKAYLEGNITMGKYTERYESAAAKRFNTKYCATSNSGSSANLLGIEALVQTEHLKPGDKVIVPKLAWSTTIFPLVQCGLVPVYVDISFEDFNICIEDIKTQITENRPKALMLIHTYGNPCDMDTITKICDENNMILIEDTCESMGASWNGRPVGSFGILGTFSSYYSHHICTLEGGLTVTGDFLIYEAMKSIRSHGWTRGLSQVNSEELSAKGFDPSFTFINSGYNLRMSDPQAAIGISQLCKLDSFISLRQRAAQTYMEIIDNDSFMSSWVKYPRINAKAISSWFGFPILIEKLDRNKIRQLRENLKKVGIESRPFLAGDFSRQPVNKKFEHIVSSSNNVKLFDESAIALPCHQAVSVNEIDKICYYVKLFIKEVA